MKESSQELIDKLSKVPSMRLATALVELRYSADCIEPAIERLLAKPKDRTTRFRTGLKKACSGCSSGQLENLLLELKDPEINPTDGFFALLELFKKDEPLITNTHDDDLDFLFTHTASELLAGFAVRLDEELVISELEDLLLADDYGVRASAWRQVTAKLSIPSLRKLEATLKGPRYTSQSPGRIGELMESLAVSLGDIALLEEALLKGRPSIESQGLIKIAKLHLARGEFQEALDRLEVDPTGRAITDYEGHQIRTCCLRQLDKTSELFLACWEKFTVYPTIDSFERLVGELGEQHRAELIVKCTEHIPHASFRIQSASLLVQLGYGELAERYVLQNRQGLEQAFYGNLAELASLLRDDGRNEAAVLCYRILLDDILKRGQSKAYHHAADYYRVLSDIDPDHNAHVLSLRSVHGRKYGFWSQVSPKA